MACFNNAIQGLVTVIKEEPMPVVESENDQILGIPNEEFGKLMQDFTISRSSPGRRNTGTSPSAYGKKKYLNTFTNVKYEQTSVPIEITKILNTNQLKQENPASTKEQKSHQLTTGNNNSRAELEGPVIKTEPPDESESNIGESEEVKTDTHRRPIKIIFKLENGQYICENRCSTKKEKRVDAPPYACTDSEEEQDPVMKAEPPDGRDRNFGVADEVKTEPPTQPIQGTKRLDRKQYKKVKRKRNSTKNRKSVFISEVSSNNSVQEMGLTIIKTESLSDRVKNTTAADEVKTERPLTPIDRSNNLEAKLFRQGLESAAVINKEELDIPIKGNQEGVADAKSTFNTPNGLKAERNHNGVKLYNCAQCCKSYTNRNTLQYHKLLHSGEKPYSCDLCRKSFLILNQLRLHIRTHTGEKPYKCKQCGASFALTGSLNSHMRTHTGEKPFKCSHCPKSFSQSSHLWYHQRTHTGEKPYSCQQCGRSFSHRNSLKGHLRTHTGEKPYQCEHCRSSFTLFGSLKKHMRIHTGERPYKCNQCPKTFAQDSSLWSHLRVHKGEKPFSCEYCQKSFPTLGNLKLHRRIHTGEKPYKCEICDSSFSILCTLRTHKRTHTGERPYQCKLCLRFFSQSSHLRTHQRTHTGEKPYGCPICDKMFADRNTVRLHQRIHTGEKPYTCPQCNKTFAQPNTLKYHLRTHTGEKPYKCDICGVSLGALGTLKNHIRMHTGDKPFKCRQCPRRFRNRINLKSHQRTHRKEEKKYQCEHCQKSFYAPYGLTVHLRRTHS